jgi:hypothetical protein
MKCRRCLEQLEDFNNDDSSIFDDDDSDIIHDGDDSDIIHDDGGNSPRFAVFEVGYGFPTILCMNCYNEYFLAFLQEREEMDIILCKFELFKQDKLFLDRSELFDLIEDRARKGIKLNCLIMQWVARGRDTSVPAKQ